MLLLDGVEGPPTTELANVLGAAAAIAGPALIAIGAPMTARLEPVMAPTPDEMELPGFIPPVRASSILPIVVCGVTVGAIVDDIRG